CPSSYSAYREIDGRRSGPPARKLGGRDRRHRGAGVSRAAEQGASGYDHSRSRTHKDGRRIMRTGELSRHLLVSRRRRVLIIVENLPVPFDRRVWQEATTLEAAGYEVSIISPKRGEYNRSYEVLQGVHVYRHPLPFEAEGPLGYAVEYAIALFFELALAVRIAMTRGVDVIHACNPPDLIFLV